ncbi:MAG: HEAT repeat domain-containing protein [Firmicutes bacterium]|nr:HEAT repeat domain-containing protein [Bacillota bacterium]
MKRTWLTVVALLALALPSACQNMEHTVQKLRSPDDNARRQAIEEIAPFGVKAIPALLAIIENPDAEPGAVMAATMALEKVVYQSTRPGATSERNAAEKALLARLQKPAPESLHRLLLRLITVVGTSQSVPTLQKLLENKTLREAARMALQQIPGKEATSAMERAFAQATDPQWKSALLMAIGARKQPSSAKVVLGALKSAQAEVRLTAITVAGEFPTPEIQKALQQIAQKGSAREKEAAQHSLVRIAERLRRSGAAGQAAPLFQWLYANGNTPTLRAAGLVGVAHTSNAGTATLLVKALNHPNPAIARTAYSLLQEVKIPGLAEALVVHMQNAQGEQRLRLIDLLGYQSGSPGVVLPSLLKAFGDNEPAVKVAALNAMGRLRHADTASALMVALGHENEQVRQAAIEAVPGVAFALQKQGKTDLATVLARTALEKARDRESVIRLAGVLRLLGSAISVQDIAIQQGMVVNWWILAPLAERSLLRQRDLVDPGAPMDLQAEVNGVRWRRIELDDPQGVLDFWLSAGARENTGGYAYAEVYSDTVQTVTLKIGSDDDVTCWVNGQKVHEFIGDRGLTIDQDTATATLQQGWNRILCKVLNGADGWQLTLRITSPDGKPLPLQQR